jgi:hypothetical protein
MSIDSPKLDKLTMPSLDPHQPSPSHPAASNPGILPGTSQATKLTMPSRTAPASQR